MDRLNCITLTGEFIMSILTNLKSKVYNIFRKKVDEITIDDEIRERIKKAKEIIDETNKKIQIYKSGNIEVADIVKDWNLDFFLGNAIKKLLASTKVKNKLEYIKSALWYLDKYVEINNNNKIVITPNKIPVTAVIIEWELSNEMALILKDLLTGNIEGVLIALANSIIKK